MGNTRLCRYCDRSGELNKDVFEMVDLCIKTKDMPRKLMITGYLFSSGVTHIEVCSDCLAKALEYCAKGLRGGLPKDEFGRI